MKRAVSILLFACLAFALSLPAAAPVSAAPRAELWEMWTPHNAESEATVDHSVWDAFLQKHIVNRGGIHLLIYSRVSDADRAALADYVSALEGVDVLSHNRAEQRAFWINLYNALTAKVVLDHYPVGSIREIDISPGVFSSGPWGKKLAEVSGEGLSLDDIEHRILRPIWKDARIHYAVNCASIGCPNLAARAFTPANTEELLDQGARDYINHPRGARVEGGRLHVSSIYEWFKDDFGGDDAGVISHLRDFAAAELKERLENITSISDDDYDWTLNETR